jgi:glycosyltransferase involved in cell wall biosynthesis
MLEYLTKDVAVSCNAPRIHQEILQLARVKLRLYGSKLSELVPLLYNYYPIVNDFERWNRKRFNKVLNIGCFGAIRPMKNHLMQAVAAIEFADRNNLILHFHINSGRVESNGNNAIKNVRALFEHLPEHKLVEHGWMDHDSFLDLIKTMDMCLQVSFTETFNIVTADAVASNVPVVVSSEMKWVSPPYADPVDSESIIKTMGFVWSNKNWLMRRNIQNLNKYSNNSERL